MVTKLRTRREEKEGVKSPSNASSKNGSLTLLSGLGKDFLEHISGPLKGCGGLMIQPTLISSGCGHDGGGALGIASERERERGEAKNDGYFDC